jgi:hypothetical protein
MWVKKSRVVNTLVINGIICYFNLFILFLFFVVPCIFSNVRVLLPNNALFIRHKNFKIYIKYYAVAPTYFGVL